MHRTQEVILILIFQNIESLVVLLYCLAAWVTCQMLTLLPRSRLAFPAAICAPELLLHTQSHGGNILQRHAVFSATCNTKLAFLETQRAHRKGWVGLDGNYNQTKIRTRTHTHTLSGPFKCTHARNWEMKHVEGNPLSFLQKTGSRRFWAGSVQTSRLASVTTHRKLSLCDLLQFGWWVCCDGFYYACMWLKNPNEAGGKYALSSTNHRFRPQGGFGYWPVSQCPLLAEKLRWQQLRKNHDS